MPILKAALVGCGEISRLHLGAIRYLPDQIQITAAVDSVREKAEKVSKETGARVFSSFDEALAAGGFNAVILLLPHHLHKQYAEQALKAGMHVLLEKPMAMNLDECRKILELARQSKGILMVGENAQYWPEVLRAKAMIKEGAIGTPLLAAACLAYPLIDEKQRASDWYKWRCELDKAGCGISGDGGLHWIRALSLLMGKVTSVFARTLRTVPGMEGESLCQASLNFESGALGTFTAMGVSSVVGAFDVFRVTGTEGEIVLKSDPQGGFGYDGKREAKLILHNKEFPQGKEVMQPEGYSAAFLGEYRDFLAAVRKEKKLEAGPESAMEDLAIAEAMRESAKQNKCVIPEAIHLKNDSALENRLAQRRWLKWGVGMGTLATVGISLFQVYQQFKNDAPAASLANKGPSLNKKV